jgi:hypothetical protein
MRRTKTKYSIEKHTRGLSFFSIPFFQPHVTDGLIEDYCVLNVRDEEEEKKGRRAQEKIKLKLEDKIVPGLILGWTDWLDASSSPSINSKQQATSNKQATRSESTVVARSKPKILYMNIRVIVVGSGSRTSSLYRDLFSGHITYQLHWTQINSTQFDSTVVTKFAY